MSVKCLIDDKLTTWEISLFRPSKIHMTADSIRREAIPLIPNFYKLTVVFITMMSTHSCDTSTAFLGKS